MQLDPNDGGARSRKLWMAYVTMLLISAGWVLTAYKPGLAPTFGEYCIFLLGASGIYAGSNATVKWMVAKKAPGVKPTPPAPPTK